MIVGEELIRIRSHEPGAFDLIPDSIATVLFRNILTRGYDVPDAEIIYELAGDRLAKLREFVERLISANEPT